ncbi:uncharacterized protein F5147DRAFT_748992 [Suillus discolor]|uniref:Transposase family Tnp2 protein n=1 Tax=Suillus discolor TaxID=1912936 RepID=A0A9P7ER89_9AGAM|nr:uncharacterized protein F5147DRAFT_748992 [Suillus discolor]KAG2082732.1 hypothetical protein F5147DRAFT_748992 [Suillus discolor]
MLLSSLSSEQSTSAAKFICVCSKHNFGRPHTISRTTWYEHLQQAKMMEEKTRMQAVHHGSNEAAPSATRRAAIAQELAKRSREISDAEHVRHRKRTRSTVLDLLPEAEEHMGRLQVDEDTITLGDDFEYEINFEHRRKPNVDVEHLAQSAVFPKIKDAMEFILLLKNASLDDPISKLLDDALDRLRNPPQGPVNIDQPGIHHSILVYLALEHGILSFYAVEKLILKYAGVESINHDMCPNTCLAYTGPYAHLDNCPICDAPRWDQARLHSTNRHVKVAAQKFSTIPLGPQLQSLYRHPDSAHNMRYLHECTQQVLEELRTTGKISIIDDIAMGWDYLGAIADGEIKENNIVLMVSLNGAQLYESKNSDCWMYVWIIVNLSPDKRYRKIHIRPGGFIPGPNKPKILDSFLVVDLYLIFTTADGPGLVYWDGMVGHSGKNGCRLYCEITGRRKTRGTHYYPALLKPRDRCVAGSDHGSDSYADNLRRLVASLNQCQWEIRKTETGLTKPLLILIPHCMTTNVMHLAGNLSELLLGLWRATIDCGPSNNTNTWDWAVLKDGEVWDTHGKEVEWAGPYLPGSFDRKPRNIAEKLNTGYKTWEFQVYTFGLGPTLLHGILPELYWANYCKLVRGFQLMCQHSITAEDLTNTHILLCTWEREFKMIYYQLKEDQLQFVRPCIHQMSHLQPSNPYANLSKEGVCSAVKSIPSCPLCPELNEPPKGLPIGAVDLGDGYALLRKHARYAIWARLLLPNGQVARSAWRENLKALEQILAVEANILDDADWRFADVAIIQLYSLPDDTLLQLSSQTVASCSHLDDLCVVPVKKIISVVAMIPHMPKLPSGVIEECFFMLEKPGLQISNLGSTTLTRMTMTTM